MAGIQDSFDDMFEKGSAAFLSFSEMAGDFAIKAKIKTQLLDQSLEFDSLMKKLGEAVYEEVKLDEHYTAAHPELFAKIEEVEQRRKALEDEYARIDSQNATQAQGQDQEQAETEAGAGAEAETQAQPQSEQSSGAQPEEPQAQDQPEGDAQ